MTPDDPRHGTTAGYVAGCRHDCCRWPHSRAGKERQLFRARHGSCRVPRPAAEAAIRPWLAMGIGRVAVAEAAGVYGHVLDQGDLTVNRSTYARLVALTEDDFGPRMKCAADLTRTRIYSLMAGGHRLLDVPIAYRGNWRTAERIHIGVARAVRSHYLANEAVVGPHVRVMAQARNAGHLPPLAWDDPGTLAWPNGIPETPTSQRVDVDEVVVDRLLAGQQTPSTRPEREEAMRRWLADGRSERSLCLMHGWRDGRYLPQRGAA